MSWIIAGLLLVIAFETWMLYMLVEYGPYGNKGRKEQNDLYIGSKL